MPVATFFLDTVFSYPAALTSAGTTTSAVNFADKDNAACVNIIFQVTVASIGLNVVVRFEGSLDGVNFFNLDSTGDTTLTANGTTGYSVQNSPLKAVRGRLVSIGSGTPTVTFVISGK
jgi:hypothetical protein